MLALRGESCSKQVERVGACCGDAASQGTCDKRFDGWGESSLRAVSKGGGGRRGRWVKFLEGLRGGAVGGELDGAVADIKEFGGDVTLPETLLLFSNSTYECMSLT